MAFPPQDVKPHPLFLKLQETPAPSEIYEFPRRGKNMQIRMMVLGVRELEGAQERAAARMKAKGHDSSDMARPTLAAVERDTIAREILCLAVRSVEPFPGSEDSPTGPRYPYIFPGLDYIDDPKVGLTRDEMTVLYAMYEQTQHKYGPYDWNIGSEAELSAWIERLAEGASAAPLARCNLLQLVELSTLLARRAYLLSALLASQRSNLPATLASVLETLGHGTGSFGELPAELTRNGLEMSDEGWTRTGHRELDWFIDDMDSFGDSTKSAARIAAKLDA